MSSLFKGAKETPFWWPHWSIRDTSRDRVWDVWVRSGPVAKRAMSSEYPKFVDDRGR